jgi:hypothetical protein
MYTKIRSYYQIDLIELYLKQEYESWNMIVDESGTVILKNHMAKYSYMGYSMGSLPQNTEGSQN